MMHENQQQSKVNEIFNNMMDSTDAIADATGSIDQSRTIEQIREIEQIMQKRSGDEPGEGRGVLPQPNSNLNEFQGAYKRQHQPGLAHQSLTISDQAETFENRDSGQGAHPLSVYFRSSQEHSVAEQPREANPERLEQIQTSFGRKDDQLVDERQFENESSNLIDTRDQYIETTNDEKHQQSVTLSPPAGRRLTQPERSDKAIAFMDDEQIMSGGMQTIFGSIDQSPKAHKTGSSFGLTQISAPPQQRSVQMNQHRAFSSINSQSQPADDNGMSDSQFNGDNYNFLGGIREVDDDEETLGGQKSATKQSDLQASIGKKEWDGSFKGSIQGSVKHEANQAPQGLYGTQSVAISQNPFIQNLQQQAMWSSGKSSSDQHLSFGGGFGQFSEPQIQNTRMGEQIQTKPIFTQEEDTKEVISPAQSQSIEQFNRERHGSPRNQLLTKVYNQALAQMGEKACMRMTMKELVILLDDLNQSVCRQAVHQEIIMSEDTPSSQMRQIMDLSLREQKDSAQKEHNDNMGTIDSGNSMHLSENQKELLHILKKKSNLQLIESVRMDFKLIQIRFKDFLSRENNIYQQLAKERERNELLQNELMRFENQAANSSLGQSHPGSIDKQDALRFDSRFKSPDENRFHPNNDGDYRPHNENLTIEQLSPVPAFKQDSKVENNIITSNMTSLQQHFQSAQNQETIMETFHDDTNQTFSQQVSNELIRKIEDKDRQISLLNDFVENLKSEINSLRQPTTFTVHSAQDEQSEITNQTVLRQNEKLVELHTHIYNLKRQNSYLEEQLVSTQQLYQGSLAQSSAQTPLNRADEIIKVQDDIQKLKSELSNVESQLPSQRLNNQVPSSGFHASNQNSQIQSIQEEEFVGQPKMSVVQFPQPKDTLTVPRQSQIRNKSQMMASHESGGRTVQTSVMRAQGVSHDGSQNDAVSLTQGNVMSQHILEQQQIQQQEVRTLQTMAETLNNKLKEQLRLNQELITSEKILKEKLNQKEKNYAEIRVLTRDLQSQATVNSEALEKAGKVIQKLNNDLQQSLDAAGKIQGECVQLREEKIKQNEELQSMEQALKEREQVNDSKIQRIDNELNLEIRDLKDALASYQNDTEGEKQELQNHINFLNQEIQRQQELIQNLEATKGAQSKELGDEVAKKTMEALNLHDQNLSLKIEMTKLEQQLEQDIDVRENLNQKQNLYLKNQINDLQVKLNSQNAKYKYNDASTHNGSLFDMDADSSVPKVNQAYLNLLQQEYETLSKELQRMRDLTGEKSLNNLESFLQKHVAAFDQFKLNVLDQIIDWHQKTAEHARLGAKYSDSLEEYKMMFIQLKQMVKEKDNMVRNMREVLRQTTFAQSQKFDDIQSTIMSSREDTLQSLKNMTNQLERKLRVKEAEIDELLQYQEEFRLEFIKVSNQRDGLAAENKQILERLGYAEKELESRRKLDFDYKEKLRKLLSIEEGPHAYEVVTDHISAMVDETKSLKMQLVHYQEKSVELTKEMEDQRTIFQTKMQEMERQLEKSQSQYLDQQNELEEEFLVKEQELESKNTELSVQIERLSQELDVRERQIRKHDQKMQEEADRQLLLQKDIEILAMDKRKAVETKDGIKESYDMLEQKLDDTNQILDKRTQEVDDLQRKLKIAHNTMDRVEFELGKANADLQTRADAVGRLDEELANERHCLHQFRDENVNLQNINRILQQENKELKEKEANLVEESTRSVELIKQLNQSNEKQLSQLQFLEGEVKRYQDSISFQCRQLDEAAVKEQEAIFIAQNLEKCQQIIESKEQEIKEIYQKYINRPRTSTSCQTEQSVMQDIQELGQEIYNLSAHVEEVEQERDLTREAMHRQMNDIDRLIDEKRVLEHEIEQKNNRISDLQRNQENVNLSNYARNRSMSPENMSHSIGGYAEKQDQLKMVLREKQNYISNLEHELNELRNENEKLKDKVIVYELENLGGANLGHSGLKVARKSGYLGFTNTLGDRTLADSRSNISATQNFSNHNVERGHVKNFTQKLNQGQTRFEHTQRTQSGYRTEHDSQNQQNQKSFERSLNFSNVPAEKPYQTSQQQTNSQDVVQQNPDYFYTLQQSDEVVSNQRDVRDIPEMQQQVDPRRSSPLRQPPPNQIFIQNQ